MSFWTGLRDTIESPITAIAGVGTSLLSNFLPKNENNNNNDQNKMINDQIQAYKDQTALTRQQLDQTRAEQGVEKRRIEQKQIRALRGTYRSAGLGAGMLGTGTSATSDQLGG